MSHLGLVFLLLAVFLIWAAAHYQLARDNRRLWNNGYSPITGKRWQVWRLPDGTYYLAAGEHRQRVFAPGIPPELKAVALKTKRGQ